MSATARRDAAEPTEASATFACFGSCCTVIVDADGGAAIAEFAVRAVTTRLKRWHRQFSRFDPTSELSRLNQSEKTAVPVTPLMAHFVACAIEVGRLTGGLVDPTLVSEIEGAGYRHTLDPKAPTLPLKDALALAPPSLPAQPRRQPGWRKLSVDPRTSTVNRPPGVRLDSGGVAKGMFADLLANDLRAHQGFAIDCGGDIRLGGRARRNRTIDVESPFDGRPIHTFHLSDAAIATSGIGRRAWLDEQGRPAHHLLDPTTGRPAYTGVVQASAIAATALEAEALAKAALLSGPQAAPHWLTNGGVLVYDDGSHQVLQRR